METESNYWGLVALYLAPVIYFLIKELILVLDGYKFCYNKGITIGFVPGIGHLTAVVDFLSLFFEMNVISHRKRSKEDCR